MPPDHLQYQLAVFAVGIERVIIHETYLPASERSLCPTAWSTRKKVCSNCRRLLGRLRKKSGPDSLNYYDWWHALKGVLTLDSEKPVGSQIFKGEHDTYRKAQGRAKLAEKTVKRVPLSGCSSSSTVRHYDVEGGSLVFWFNPFSDISGCARWLRLDSNFWRWTDCGDIRLVLYLKICLYADEDETSSESSFGSEGASISDMDDDVL